MTSRSARCSDSDFRSKLTPPASSTIRGPSPRTCRTPSSMPSTSRCDLVSSLRGVFRLRVANGNGDLIAVLLTMHGDPQVIDQQAEIRTAPDGERHIELSEIRLDLMTHTDVLHREHLLGQVENTRARFKPCEPEIGRVLGTVCKTQPVQELFFDRAPIARTHERDQGGEVQRHESDRNEQSRRAENRSQQSDHTNRREQADEQEQSSADPNTPTGDRD